MGATQSLSVLQNQSQSLAFKQYPFGDQAWNLLWDNPTTPEQLWSCFNDALLIQMRDTQPANFATLIHKTVGKLAEIVFASKGTMAAVKPLQNFANTYTSSVVNNTPAVKGAEDPVVVSTTAIMLNCVRILTRCISLLVEQPTSAWFAGYLWGGPLPAIAGQTIEPAVATGNFGSRPLGETILLLLLDLLFTEGFCVHQSLATTVPNKHALRHNGVQLDKLWEISTSPNTGYPIAGPPNLPNVHQWLNKSVGWSNFDPNRIEVLRCLMACCSETMFMPPPTIGAPTPAPASSSSSSVPNAQPNRFLQEFVSETGPCSRWTPCLFWSLLNLVLNYHPEGQAIVALPYNYALYTDNREPLVEVSLQFLLMVLDYRHGETLTNMVGPTQEARKSAVVVLNPPTQRPEDVSTSSSSSSASNEELKSDSVENASQALSTVSLNDSSPKPPDATVPALSSNVFHAIFTELSNPACLSSIYTNICRLLLNALMAESTYLPQSLKKMYAFQELLILTWKLADENPNFIPHILHPPPGSSDKLDILHLITPLLYFVNESRKVDSQLGLLYTGVFLLLRLSGDREFSVALNRYVYSVPTVSHIPLWSLLDIPSITNGTYADCLIVVAHKLITSSPNHLDALLKVLLTLLCNISPYLTKLSLFASTKLLALFELFASPTFLNANSSNHQYASMMLDVFNNVIQYQYLGHANLVYSIIRRAKYFFDLGRLEHLPGMPEQLTVEEQQRRLQAGQQRVDINSVNKVASAVTSTIELAERPSSSPVGAQTQPAALPPANIPEPSTVAAQSSLPSSTVPVPSFKPTPQWANHWKRQLPLEPIYRLLEFFEPRVQTLIHGKSAIDENAIITVISQTTLVGVLPVPHPIVVRKYIPNRFTDLWFSTFQAGIIFLRQQALSMLSYGIMSNAPLWNGRAIKMFMIALPQLSPQQEAERTRQAQQLAERRQRMIEEAKVNLPQAATAVPQQQPTTSVPKSAPVAAAVPTSVSQAAPPAAQLPLPVQPTESTVPVTTSQPVEPTPLSTVAPEAQPAVPETSPSPPEHATTSEVASEVAV